MTRDEHIQWCKERAIQEMDFHKKPSMGLVSMASDLRKHPATNNQALIQLCVMQSVMNPYITRQEVINFLDGFN